MTIKQDIAIIKKQAVKIAEHRIELEEELQIMEEEHNRNNVLVNDLEHMREEWEL